MIPTRLKRSWEKESLGEAWETLCELFRVKKHFLEMAVGQKWAPKIGCLVNGTKD